MSGAAFLRHPDKAADPREWWLRSGRAPLLLAVDQRYVHTAMQS